MMTETSFNSAPIMLQPPTKQQLPSSLTMNQPTEEDILANMIYHIDASPSYHDQHDDFDDAMMMMPVPQHLDSEQINYEFPPKSHLKALAYLDQLEQEYSFFDETSFTSLSNDSSSSASSMSFLSGYFDEQLQDNSSATTPLRHDYISSASHLFSSLIDENDEDLDLTHIHSHHDYHMTQAQSSKEAAAASTTTTTLVDDNRLSPLQLPAQAHHYSYHHQREQSCDSTTTITKNLIVAPQSFLSMPSTAPLYKSNNNANYDNNGKRADLSALVHSSTCSVTQTESYIHSRLNSLSSVDLPIIISETEPILDQDDDDNDEDCDSMTSDYLYSHQHQQQHVVLIKINKLSKTHQRRQQDRCPTSLTYLGSDEGYDDEDLDGKLSLGPEIESASVFLPLEDEEDYGGNSSTDKAHSAWTHFQQQQQQWTRRIQYLEQQLDEERAMREAFEKAMEDMTVLMDQQQNVLYDRLEQEISMRQAYEHKVQQTAALVQPLQDRLETETTARMQLEETMVHVLEQVQLLQSQHQQHLTDDAAQRKRMQKKLDKALDDISELSTRTSTTNNNNTKTSAPTIVSTRPSKMPSSSSTRSNVTSSPSSKSTKSVIKPAARPPTTNATKPTTPIINRSKQPSIVPSSSRRTKLPNNGTKRLTTTPAVKSGLESLKQSPSASKRLVSHR